MQCTLLIPNLFWPDEAAQTVTQGLQLPALTKLTARAHRAVEGAITLDAWLCEAFGVSRQRDYPIAPFTLAMDGIDPGCDYWLRADPVHLKVSRDRLLLVDASLFEITAEEAQSLLHSLNQHFSAEAIAFVAPAPLRWYAKLERRPDVVMRSLGEVAGKDVQNYLPAGGEALEWHRLFNESQMVLHEHAVNERREARGAPPLNSVWFWGGGVLPAVPRRQFTSVSSDNAIAVALARASGAAVYEHVSDANSWITAVAASAESHASHLIVRDELFTAFAYRDMDAWRERVEGLERKWFAPLIAKLGDGSIDVLSVVVLGAQASCRFVLRRSDLLKLWRRPASLSACA